MIKNIDFSEFISNSRYFTIIFTLFVTIFIMAANSLKELFNTHNIQ